ncbi:multidrug ABC transporter ATP-binding protein [Aerococcus urinaehominis]|uniref:Multidrug ABC transporter ATP-binding protein n=1 Tax=Aerococcus urinaehominis TaxID=128944 RepID=A0A0X8FJZ0_9LACT|nr:ABC-F family ATP-binding cassette domain-containing protein [Aerococcus urinaehominis]AMB98701.1 multidrug ABC transporter ATP-binding protein [Aerococcus urinaehominis]SDL99200.1 ATP-binding cassette, subfamily F, uup [Aerococcus urinaehominis]
MKDFKAENWSKTYGIKQLLDNVSFFIKGGDHIGLVGANGSGKSTLLQILSGQDEVDAGDTEKAKDFTVALVAQDPDLNPKLTIFETIYAGDSPQVALVKAYEEATNALALAPDDLTCQQRFSQLEQRMNQEAGWQLDTKIRTILNKLGINQLDQQVSELSGGQRKRIGLAKVLIDEPDLLLMDEPTNHLDFDMVKWLEDYIHNYKKSVLVVTHDRYFLDRVADRMFALQDGQLKEYQGNYQDYLTQRAEEEAHQASHLAKQKKLYQQELAWMRKGAKARTTKQQARINRFENLEESLKGKTASQDLNLDFEGQRLGNKVISLEQVAVGYEASHPLLKDINLLVQNRDRIGIIGDNGVGKSTLLNTIAGLIPPLAGTIELGETVRLAYFDQLAVDLPEDERLINYIQEVANEYVYADGRSLSAAQMLETFLFPRPSHGALIASLSGGEKKRLYLLQLLMQRPNVLFLDEPTNDLDIDTLTVLEDYLADFAGAVITVSHDRYFLDKLADKLLVADRTSRTTHLFYGNYSDYEASQADHAMASQPVSDKKQEPTKHVSSQEKSGSDAAKKRRMTWQEKQDWAVIEDQISALEDRLSQIDEEMTVSGSDYGKLADLQREKEAIEIDLEAKMIYWEELAELAE